MRLNVGDDIRIVMAKVSIWLHWLAAILALLLLAVPPTGAGLAERIVPLALGAIAFSIFLHRFPWQKFPARLFVLTSFLDLLLIAGGVSLSGGAQSRYALLFFLVVVFSAYFYSVRDAVITLLATVLAFCLPLVYGTHTLTFLPPFYASAAGVMVLVAAVTKQTVIRVDQERSRRDILESERKARYEEEVERRTSLQQKTRQLESILEMGNAFRLQLGLDLLLEKIVSAIGETAGFKAVVVRLFDPDSGEALCKAVYGIDRHLVELPTPPELIKSLMAPRFQVSRSYLVHVESEALEHPETKPYLLVRNPTEAPSGEWTPAHSLIVPLETGEHGLIGIISIDEPIDGRIPSEDTIQTLEIFANLAATAIDNARLLEEAGEARALRELDRLKSEFLATISHDFRTPLTVIKGSIDLLETQVDDSQPVQKRLIQGIGRNTSRLTDMVQQLLEMIQLQEGKIILHRRLIDIREVVSETVETLVVANPASAQQIRIAAGSGPAVVMADRARVQQILTNLVGNACKYGPEDEPVKVRIEDGVGEVEVSVRDHGMPIPSEDRRRIFEKFYRAESMAVKAGGSGLGLAICQSLVELHGGRIWLETDSGGNTFRFSLPKEPAS